jgi:WD40 repeat protein
VWNAATGACERVLKGYTDLVNAVCVLADGRLASASLDYKVRVWDAATGACKRVLEGHTDLVVAVCALADGRLASASKDRTVRMWFM